MKLSLPLALIALSLAGAAALTRGTPAVHAAVESPTAVAAPSGYATALAELDARIDDLQERAASRPDDWLVRMHLGTSMLERAGLTHDADDYTRLQQRLDEAFAIAPEGSGPLLVAARFELSIHRLERAQALLDRMDRRPLRRRDDQIAGQVLRAQIATQRGHYDEALALLEQAAEAAPQAATVDLALLHAKLGARDRADALLQSALQQTPPRDARRRAWIGLQRGLLALEQGQLLQALELLQQADAALSGWWLVQEHLAEVHDRLGQHGRAIALLEALVAEHGLPQHADALATAHRHAGDEARAVVFAEQASRGWAALAGSFPEAAMGHAIEHELQHGEPARALELAQANVALRPGGDAQLLLARALLAVARPADALAVIERVLGTRYRTAALHRVAEQVFTAAGRLAQAQQQREACLAIDPGCAAALHSH
ncbi:MAG: hypothetical protein K1X88_03525 [Nannocystaceae bacterium]|nr:hypothetical protein [Nannocystaceae bacterium]